MSEIPKASHEGVSVSIEEARVAFRGLSKAYSQYASAVGLRREVERDKLVRRYGQDWRRGVETAMTNARKAVKDAEAGHMSTLTREEDLTNARFIGVVDGEEQEVRFDPRDVETGALVTKVSLRQEIGINAGAAARRHYLAGMYEPEAGQKSLLKHKRF